MCNNNFGSLHCCCCVGLHSCYRIRFFLGVAYPVAVFYWHGKSKQPHKRDAYRVVVRCICYTRTMPRYIGLRFFGDAACCLLRPAERSIQPSRSYSTISGSGFLILPAVRVGVAHRQRGSVLIILRKSRSIRF